MRKIFKYFIIISILIGLFFIVSAYSYATTISKDLEKNIFRLHIIANSDSIEDQTLKLKVRDAVLEYMKTLTEATTDKNSVIEYSKSNIDKFKEIAQNVIKENGYDYSVNIEIGNFYFPTKYYGNISLPSGNYDAMRIKIGKAEGQNWWCSLFPPLCFVNISSGVIDEQSENYLKSTLSDEEFSIISSTNPEIEFKFKIIELINKK